jgi:hypothetical protein
MLVTLIIENLLLMLPALLVVAYVTVAERKTMASMQRRLGPNAVGQKNNRFSLKRFYHTSSYDKAIEVLYKNRKAPVKPFKENVVSICKDLLSSTVLSTFFKDLKGKGGYIYVHLKK